MTSSLNHTYLYIDHALDDRVSLHAILGLLRTLNDIHRRGVAGGLDLTSQLNGIMDVISLVDQEDYYYLLLWLAMTKIETMFPEPIVQLLRRKIRAHPQMDARGVIEYLIKVKRGSDSPLAIEIDGTIPMLPDVVEAMVNAVKYSRSYIHIESDDDENIVIIRNDIREHISGTQFGLEHHAIQTSIENEEFTARVAIDQPRLSIAAIFRLAKDVGWTTEINLNGSRSTGMAQELAHRLAFEHTAFYFKNTTIRDQAVEMLKDIFSKHIDSLENVVLISRGELHDGINVTVGLTFYNGIRYYPEWLE